MTAISQSRDKLTCVEACAALGVSRASYYRDRRNKQLGGDAARDTRQVTRSPRALSEKEERAVLDVLRSPRFQDQSIPQVWACLLDEGQYLSSMSTMYRILHRNAEIRERRNQLRRPNYSKPELLATGPNQVWSWDITKLKGPRKWTYYYLYVLLDIYSRYVVGWMVASCETALLAKKLWGETAEKYDIKPDQLVLSAANLVEGNSAIYRHAL